MSSQPSLLPPFPVDDETLNVVRDSLDQVIAGFDEDGHAIREGSEFGLDDVLDLLSGYDPSQMVQMLDEYGQPIPDTYEYVGGAVYHPHDLIRALIDEIRRLRANGATA